MSVFLEVQNLKKFFDTPRGKLHAVDNVSFTIKQGTTLGIVGESGCGKSTLGRTLLHLLESTAGRIIFQGKDITSVSRKELCVLREQMQIIFQDPFASLNPRMSVSQAIADPLKNARRFSRPEIEEQVEGIMDLVGLPQRLANVYPHELDGGRRQRIVIARALALNPQFVVCDEPVSALDVSIQAQILNLLMDLQEKLGLTYIFITHDLSVVRHISQEICVMYLGEIVEKSDSKELFRTPLHPYTKALLSAVPIPDIHLAQKPILIKGELTSPVNPEPGCRFLVRCPFKTPECALPQKLQAFGENHFVMCVHAQNIES